ncbi:MAG: FkbM family methyltransferase [Proteobacteria bacterium]|nr:MAG: FkbM family methyltransferase [Pseudomonadota bacterium]
MVDVDQIMSHHFGHFAPDEVTAGRITWCRKLPTNWLGKQLAQWQRKRVIRDLDGPLDLRLDGIKLRVFLVDNVSERSYVFMPWRFDALERELMQKLLPKDGVMVDIGANAGIYSCLAARQLGQSGVLVAFEPNPEMVPRLRFNLESTLADCKELPRLEIQSIAVSDETGSIPFYLNRQNLGASSMIEDQQGQCIDVECQPLLDVIESLKLSRIHVLKCDVEGSEDRALVPFFTDAPNHLLPGCVIIEHNPEKWQLPLLEVIKQRGYVQSHRTRMNVVLQQRRLIKLSDPQQVVRKAVKNSSVAGLAHRESNSNP